MGDWTWEDPAGFTRRTPTRRCLMGFSFCLGGDREGGRDPRNRGVPSALCAQGVLCLQRVRENDEKRPRPGPRVRVGRGRFVLLDELVSR